jgi:PAS domain S-box-containing protein
LDKRTLDGQECVVMMHWGISDRKQAEEALRESEELFRRAFDDAPIGISLVSETGQFLKVNAYYSNLLGYTQEELLALKFQEITHPADFEVDMAGFRKMLAGDIRSFEMRKRFISKQGIAIPVQMYAAVIRNHHQQPLYVVGHIQDIRDRLEVERMKDEFISIISHELRTPLTSIRGALDLLASGIYDKHAEKSKRMLEIAISNSDRLVRLVNDLLDLERLDSGKVRLIKQPCQIVDLMQQAVDSVQAIADQSIITLSLTSISATLSVAPDSIIQTLTNLLSNAIKFSPPGSTVWLKAEEFNFIPPVPTSSSPTSYILFSVEDQGRGIPVDQLETIFEKFQQVDVSDSRQKGGTGLGLAICKKIVQQHSGEIWVESVLGKGSTFYFTLPLVKQGEND